MALVKMKKLIEDLEKNSTLVLSSAYIATTAGNAGTAAVATTAVAAGTAAFAGTAYKATTAQFASSAGTAVAP